MVFKIGGSILSNIDDLDFAAARIAQYVAETKNIPIIAISAFKNYTDDLVRMVQKFATNESNRSGSFVVTVGEQITAGLFALALEKYGINAKPFAGWQLPIIVDSKYEDNIYIDTARIQKELDSSVVPVITGFQGIDKNSEVCDLGRGGTDLTAIYLAKVFNAECVLLKKSGGVCSADPDLISNCFVWDKIGYDNLLQLAESGSRVVQKDALLIAKAHNVPLKVTGIDFTSNTMVSDHNIDFWSVFETNHKLRVVTTKMGNILKENGFKHHGFFASSGYYEFNRVYFDMHLEAYKIYNICKQNLWENM